MSDLPAHKKGMRTFASDFKRIKSSSSASPQPVPKTPTANPVPSLLKPSQLTTAPVKAISKTIQKPEVPKKIPAFHEIEKTLGDIDLSGAGKNTKTSLVHHSNRGITPSRRVGGGAIITDTRTSSFSLFGETKKSITDWFKKRKKKPTPKLAVSKADRRKGVIQQATTKSGTIFTADSETLKERIKARKLQEHNQPENPETNWSPYTETGYALLESGEHPIEKSATIAPTENVVVEFKKRSVPAVAVPDPVLAPAPVLIAEPIMAPEVPAILEATPAVVTEPAETQPSEEAEVPVVTSSEPEPTVPPVKQIDDEPALLDQLPPEPAYVAQAADGKDTTLTTNQLTMYISGGFALILITGFFGWVIMINTPSVVDSNNPQLEQFVERAASETITIDQTFTASSLQSYPGTATYTEVVLANSDEQLLPAALIFELVAPDMPTTIRQFATDIRFVQSGAETPQMMIRVVDPISVTGALLVHESDLVLAMTPLYGQIEAGDFTDRTIAGTDARVLVSNTRESLTYGIIDGETLLIAISPDAFAEIKALLAN